MAFSYLCNMRNALFAAVFVLLSIPVSCDSKKAPVPTPGPEVKEWIQGADLSLLPSYMDAKAVYKDMYGKQAYPISYFKELGFNYMRVRLFVDPDLSSTACQDLEYVLNLLTVAKDAQMKTLLDFHYSDTWADPGKQYLPKAWQGLSTQQLAVKIEEYTRDVLRQLVKKDLAPDMIQTGNEISNGMLWDNARVSVWNTESKWNTPQRWAAFTQILSKAVKACRDICPDSQILMHYDNGGSREGAALFFSQLAVAKVDYDIIGLSYYPFWHGPLSQLKATLDDLAIRFPDTPVNIVEVAYPYHNLGIDANATYELDYPATAEGQKQFFSAFLKTLHACPNVNGYMYWYPEETYVPDKPILKLYRGIFGNANGQALQITEVLED